MQAATWRCDAKDVAVATAAAAVRRSDVGELHVRSIRPTMARCDACLAGGALCVGTCPTGALSLPGGAPEIISLGRRG